MASALLVFVGGGTGSLVRFGLGRGLSLLLPDFPLGTVFANTAGAFLIGLFTVLFIDRNLLGSPYREMLIVGFLGGLTTFSSFCYDAYLLYSAGRWPALAAYIAANLLAGFGLFAAGRAAGSL
jgi:CrcB protein